MARPSGLELLPPEIWVDICQELSQRSMSSLGACSRRLNAAISPILFSEIKIDLFDKDWAVRALSAVQPDTWRHVKTLDIQINGEAGLQEFKDASYRQHINLRAIFFRTLSPLTRIIVSFGKTHGYELPDGLPTNESRSRLQQFMESVSWLSHAKLIQLLAHRGDPKAQPSLKLSPPSIIERCGDVLPHQTWRLLLEPFRIFGTASVRLDASSENRKVATPSYLKGVAGHFSPDWVTSLKFSSGRKLSCLKAFSNISNLRLDLENKLPQEDLGDILTGLSSSLQKLHLSNMPFQTDDVPNLPSQLYRMKRLTGSGAYLSIMEQIVRRADLPELKYFDLQLHTSYGCVNKLTLPVLAGQFLSLERWLPERCRNRDEVWRLRLEVADLQGNEQIMATLKDRSGLRLEVLCDGFLAPAPTGDAGLEEEDDLDIRVFDTAALAEVVQPAGLALVDALQVDITAAMIWRPGCLDNLNFKHLSSLEVDIYHEDSPTCLHILRHIFTCISAPSLSESIVHEHSELVPDTFQRILAAITTCLPLWPRLQTLQVYSFCSEEDIFTEKDYDALLDACRMRDIDLCVC